MVIYNNEIGVLPQERENLREERNEKGSLYASERNEENEQALKKQIKKPKLTSEQFHQHLNADQKLKAAYAEHQALMERQKQATERVKNTGYLGTLWGGITGDSGVDQLAKINEEMNDAHTKFRNALDNNASYSKDLKQQLQLAKLQADSGLNAATAQAAGNFSDRAGNYAGTTIAVRNTAIGAGLGVSAVLTGGATLGAASTILAGGGSATMLGGAVAGGALTGALGNTGYSLLRDEAGVVVDSGVNHRNIGIVQNEQNEQILKNSAQATRDGAKFGVALPLVANPYARGAMALAGSFGGARSIVGAGENISNAYGLSKQESEARQSGNTELAEKLKTQKNAHITEGVLSAGDTAAILGAGGLITRKLSNSRPNSSQPVDPSKPSEIYLGPKTKVNTRKNTKPVEGIDLPSVGTGMKKVVSAEQGSPRTPTTRPEIDVTWNPDGTRTTKIAGFDQKGNFRIRDDSFPPYDPTKPNQTMITKATGTGETSQYHRNVAPIGKNKYTYQKKGDNGDTVASRVRDFRGNGRSEVQNPDTSVNVRTYGKTFDGGSLSTFKSPLQDRVNISTKDGTKITYDFDTTSPLGVSPKTHQIIRRPNGSTFKGEANLPSNSSERIRYRSVEPDQLSPEKPSLPKKRLSDEEIGTISPDMRPQKTQPLPDSRIKTTYQSRGRNNFSSNRDTNGYTTNNLRQYRQEIDMVNDTHLGRTQTDSSITFDTQSNMLKRRVVTHGPHDTVNSPTQISQARRIGDSNGDIVSGTNQTRLSDGSQRVAKTNSDGIMATHISANGDVKQRQWNRKLEISAKSSETPQVPDNLKTAAKPESVQSKENSVPKKLLSDEEIGIIQRDGRSVEIPQ